MKTPLSSRVVDLIFSNGKILSLLFVFLVVTGAVALSQMQRQGFPDVTVNVAGVTVIYPNASPAQVEEAILIPIESALADMESVTDIQATAADSYGSVFVTFDQNVDMSAAIADLKGEIATVRFPESATEPRVDTFSVNGTGEFVVAVSGYEDEHDLYEAGKRIELALRAVDGVKETVPQNALTPEIVILFDRAALEHHGLGRDGVEQVIRSAQFKAPVGSFTDTTSEQTISVVMEKQFASVEDFRNIIVAEGVTLHDVATVEERYNNNDRYNRIGFRDENILVIERALLYGVRIEKDADILNVAEGINEAIAEFEDGEDGSALVVYSQADATRLQIEEITQSIFGKPIESLGFFGFVGYLFGGLAFVVILLFLFMNLRVAILSALAIPLSLFFAAIYLYLMGITLNTLVLFSMVLTIGLVVDPTIVFLESMQRFKEQGFTGREAARRTMATVGFGVFLAVATNVLVFVPFGVVSGFFGELIKYIPATIIPAMVASMVIPIIFFVPFAASFLRPSKRSGQGVQDELTGTWWIGRKVGEGLNWMLGAGGAKAVLRVIVFLFMIGLPVIVGGALIASGGVEVVQFASQDDSDYMIISGELPSDWTFEKAVYDVVVPFQNELMNHEEILNFSYFGQSGNDFTVLVTLLPIAERADTNLRTSDELARDLNEAFDVFAPDADIKASTSSEGPPQEAFPVRVRFVGGDTAAISAAADDVKAYLQGAEGIDVVKDNYSEGAGGGSITATLKNGTVNTTNPYLAYGVANARIGEGDLGELRVNGTTYEVVSSVSPAVTSFDELARTHVPTAEEMVYAQQIAALRAQGIENPEQFLEAPADVVLGDLFANVQFTTSTIISRSNGERYVEVFASIDEDADSLAIQSDLRTYLDEEKMRSFGLETSNVDFDGEADSIAESFTDLFIALGIAIFLIYLLLVAAFRSFLEPFIILFAIPLGLVGVFIAVWATSGQLGFLELLGVVAMAGIVVNVTILIIDYANQLVREGKAPSEAIATSIAIRFRPIVLTQLTAFGSLIPLVYLSPFWQGLAASIIFGIASSALLSLLVTPILYRWAHTSERIVRDLGRRISARQRLHE